jgi:hypothetical protein
MAGLRVSGMLGPGDVANMTVLRPLDDAAAGHRMDSAGQKKTTAPKGRGRGASHHSAMDQKRCWYFM